MPTPIERQEEESSSTGVGSFLQSFSERYLESYGDVRRNLDSNLRMIGFGGTSTPSRTVSHGQSEGVSQTRESGTLDCGLETGSLHKNPEHLLFESLKSSGAHFHGARARVQQRALRDAQTQGTARSNHQDARPKASKSTRPVTPKTVFSTRRASVGSERGWRAGEGPDEATEGGRNTSRAPLRDDCDGVWSCCPKLTICTSVCVFVCVCVCVCVYLYIHACVHSDERRRRPRKS